jgi:NADH dehydrogenase FAD-containing subunit
MRAVGRIVLLGAGHAHAGVLLGAGRLARRGHEVVLVAPGDFWYSGLATGVLGGRHAAEADRVDVGRLAASRGVRWLRGRAVAIEAAARRVRLEDGATLDWDALSLDVGSEVGCDVPGAAEHAVPVKPIAGLAALAGRLARAWPAAGPRALVVVGAGASGTEVAANLAALARRCGASARITVVGRDARLLPAMPPGAGAWAARALARRGIALRLGAAAVGVDADAVHLATGERLRHDLVLWATGLRAPSLAAASELPVDAAGAVRVDEHLAVLGHPRVFGGGDCIAYAPRALPKIGVYAVREAPILLHNLAAAAAGGRRRPFRPQRRALLILNLGDGTALAVRGRWWWHGRTALWLKDRIDTRWLARLRWPDR